MEEEEALRLAEGESLAMKIQQEDEEASLRAALHDLEVSGDHSSGGVKKTDKGKEKMEEDEREDEREEAKNEDDGEEPARQVGKSEEKPRERSEQKLDEKYECQICMEEYAYYEIFLV